MINGPSSIRERYRTRCTSCNAPDAARVHGDFNCASSARAECACCGNVCCADCRIEDRLCAACWVEMYDHENLEVVHG